MPHPQTTGERSAKLGAVQRTDVELAEHATARAPRTKAAHHAKTHAHARATDLVTHRATLAEVHAFLEVVRGILADVTALPAAKLLDVCKSPYASRKIKRV